MKISQIKNVNYTLNKPSFGTGVQTNYGLNVPPPKDNMVEGGLITGFVGTVAPAFNKIHSRAKSIENGLNEQKINYMA